MARKKNKTRIPAASVEPEEPGIFEATLGTNGAVHRGPPIDLETAVERRRNGFDIVVCGPDSGVNRRLAGHIERTANGNVALEYPHRSAGVRALPHWQPDPRPPRGHSFYETEHRKAS